MNKLDVDRAIDMGLKAWSEVAPLTFVKTNQGEADIMISFESGGIKDVNVLHDLCADWFQ